MARDPLQGLIDYVLDVKPYHTKILDVALGYAQNESVDVTITENLDIETTIIRLCNGGYGNVWDRPSEFVVVDAAGSPSGSTNEIVLDGLHAGVFEAGTRFEVREPVAGSPQIFTFTVQNVSQGGSPERTTITTTTAVNPASFFVPPYPPGNNSFGDVFVIFDLLTTNVTDNTIFVSGNQSQKEQFYYGRSFEIRGTGFPPLDRTYSTLAVIPGVNQFGILVAGSPVTVPLTSSTGELVVVPDGYDSEEFCGSPQIFKGFQYFILETDNINNSFKVQGDATGDIQVGTYTIRVENAISPGVPISFNQNNGAYSVLSVSYDGATDRTTIFVDPPIIDPYPTGYILPT